MLQRSVLCLMGLAPLGGCNGLIFPIWDPLYFEAPPAALGPWAWDEFRVEVPEGADGEPTGLTVFEPQRQAADGPAPSMFWVLGSNVQAYYHQSLHETLASWGYVVVVSDGRPLTYSARQYHRRTVDLAKQAIALALDGEVTAVVPLDPERVAVGGYSIGGPMALFTAAEAPEVDSAVLWAPTGSPFWNGVRPRQLYPEVTQDVLMVVGELDRAAPPDGFPSRLAEQLSAASRVQTTVLEGAVHTQFQQPVAEGANEPDTELTRFAQQGLAIEATRQFLDASEGNGP